MKDILRYLATWKFWKELIIMTLGMAIAAAAVYYFMVPSKLVLGSISGLSIVVSNLFDMAGFPVKVSWVVMAINAILLVLAWIFIGKEFGAKTVYTAMILGPLIDLWEKVYPYENLIESVTMSSAPLVRSSSVNSVLARMAGMASSFLRHELKSLSISL